MSGILGPDYVNIFFIGTGASGTIITLFRMVSLAAIPSENCNFVE
jgi:equilibrative nucleoside transporter 1/2/3